MGNDNLPSSSSTEIPKLPDNSPIILTWVPREKGRSLSDDNLQIVIDHVNEYNETRDILLCINSSGFESGQKEAIRQKLDERLGDKAQQVKIVDLLGYDWSIIDQDWKIDGKDISIKDYYTNMYSKAPGKRIYFPVELDTFRMIALALSEQITGKRGAIYVDFDTLSAIKEPLGQDIKIPKGILVGDITGIDSSVTFVNNDLIAIDKPELAVNFLYRYNSKIKSEEMLCQDAKEILESDYSGNSLNELFETRARGDLGQVTSFLFKGEGKSLIITHLEFRKYVDFFMKYEQDGYTYTSKKLVSFEENGGKYPSRGKIDHTFSWLDIPSREIRAKYLKIREDISAVQKEDVSSPKAKEEAKKKIRELAHYIKGVKYKLEIIRNINTAQETLLYLAVYLKDEHLAKDLIDMGDNVNFEISEDSPLRAAIRSGREAMVNLLVNNGAEVNDEIIQYAKANTKNTAIIKILEQHRLSTGGCLQPTGRGKRAAGGNCRLSASEYIESLRKLPIQEQIRFTQANEIDFIGSSREIQQAERARDLLLSDTSIVQKSYEISKLFEDPREKRILDLSEGLQSGSSESGHPRLKQRLMNAAGRIQLLQGVHDTFASCESGGLSTDCARSVGEMGFSFLSQPIENGMLKITPRVVKSAASAAGKVPALGKNLKFAIQLKGMKFGKPIARGVGGALGGAFDIVDIGMSANTLNSLCKKKRKR